MLKVSREFKARVKLADEPAYKLAIKARVNPTTLSKLMHGIEPIRINDERIGRVAALLGMKAQEAFDVSEETCGKTT